MADPKIELIYDLFALATAQHRAGLAGLLVLIESMHRRKIKPLPEVTKLADGRVSIRLNRETLQSVLNDLYNATWEEQSRNQKLTKGKGANKQTIPPKREEKKKDEKTGKEKTVYIYDQVVPKAAFLAAFHMPDIWLKLWRDTIWGILRDKPRTRIPFEQRADGKALNELNSTWKDLQRFQQARSRNEIHTVEIPSSIFIGAQAENAERVPFLGKTDEAFLLNFWSVVMGVYVPEVIDREGKTRFEGYVLTVPDVLNLDGFVQDFPETVAQMGNQGAGYRPKGAVISLPQEGGLEYIHHLMELAKAKAQAGAISYNVSGVEVYHLEKRGNNIHVRTADRVTATPEILERYDAIRGRYHNPLFRRQIILNLLREEGWYQGFDRVFAKNNWKHFIGEQAQWFSMDVRRRFETQSQERRSA